MPPPSTPPAACKADGSSINTAHHDGDSQKMSLHCDVKLDLYGILFEILLSIGKVSEMERLGIECTQFCSLENTLCILLPL
jgi:hypothetical protein